MPYIILDRDGVINYDSEYYIKSPEEWNPIPGSLEAIAKLNHAGFRVFVVTNQSGLARGYYDEEILGNIHQKFLTLLASVGGEVEAIFFCPHHPDDKCGCRKPEPGLFKEIEKKYPIHLADTYFIGDSVCDIKAARAAGCKPILVMTGNGKKTLEENLDLSNVLQFNDLAAAVDGILGK